MFSFDHVLSIFYQESYSLPQMMPAQMMPEKKPGKDLAERRRLVLVTARAQRPGIGSEHSLDEGLQVWFRLRRFCRRSLRCQNPASDFIEQIQTTAHIPSHFTSDDK